MNRINFNYKNDVDTQHHYSYPEHLISQDSELGTLGYIMLKHDSADQFERLKREYFATEPSLLLFDAIEKAYKLDKPFDFVHVDCDNVIKLEAISKTGMQVSSFSSGFQKIVSLYLARKAHTSSMSVQELLMVSEPDKGVFDTIQEVIDDYRASEENNNVPVTVSEALGDWFDRKAESLVGVDSQKLYDMPLNGLQEYQLVAGHLAAIVARTKSGKTTLLCQVALDAVKKQRPVLFVSLEVSSESILDKMLALEAQVNPFVTQNFNKLGVEISDESIMAVKVALEKLASLPLSIYDGAGVTLSDLRSKIRDFMAKNLAGIIIIDQLQFIEAGKRFDSRVYEYDYILRGLKRFALEYKTIIFLAHQLNRDIEKRGEAYPQTSDIKDSGRVEEISDLVVMFAKKNSDDGDENRYCRVISRHWAGKKVVLNWDSKKAKFV